VGVGVGAREQNPGGKCGVKQKRRKWMKVTVGKRRAAGGSDNVLG
jgi:hypothetical protein